MLLELAVSCGHVRREVCVYHFGVGRIVQHHGRGDGRHRVMQRAELSWPVRVDAVVRELTNAGLFEITADLGFVVAQQGAHVLAAREVVRHRVVDIASVG